MNINKYKTKNNLLNDKIIHFINDFPGIRHRELLRVTGASNGILSYRLRFLVNSHKIRKYRINNRETRYFPYNVSLLESRLVGLLRQSTTRKIIVYLLESGPCRFNDIVSYTKKVPATVSWHLSKLRYAYIIQSDKKDKKYFYQIRINKTKLLKLLNKYKNIYRNNYRRSYKFN
ncbi:MAG TPA: ArsR family transcriptional regulator [Nitrososphaeraceae archaeon]|nr:ArsR family transcriptional regulator [Nitrososphaeraceae archaeon]